MRKYKIKSELSEKQIESDVASYFGWMTKDGNLPFRLLDVNEQQTGADKKFQWCIPLYFQFKVSHGLISIDEAPISKLKNFFDNSPLNRIRIFRKKNDLSDNPTLYFKLREIARNADDFQHNILMRLSNTGFSHAFYVAPLVLGMKEYEEMLFQPSFRYLHSPFIERQVSIFQEGWVSEFSRVPFLRSHISIVPHESVNTADHHYSFSSSGTEIGWHSPQILNNKAYRLSDTFQQVIKEGKGIHISEMKNAIISLCDICKIEYKDDEDYFYNFDRISEKLNSDYSIKQFLLVFDEKIHGLWGSRYFI